MANKITPKKDGDQLGCTDMAAPEKYTPAQLSRLHDFLLAAQRFEDAADVPLLTAHAFKLLPETLKLEFNYSKWKYQSN
jgi:hypothetical protein